MLLGRFRLKGSVTNTTIYLLVLQADRRGKESSFLVQANLLIVNTSLNSGGGRTNVGRGEDRRVGGGEKQKQSW